jgi:hypothetical protein
MSQDVAAEGDAQSLPAPPAFDPDPALIAHLEGNASSLRGYRQEAERLRDEARQANQETSEHG